VGEGDGIEREREEPDRLKEPAQNVFAARSFEYISLGRGSPVS
jgi:hypothetical protein